MGSHTTKQARLQRKTSLWLSPPPPPPQVRAALATGGAQYDMNQVNQLVENVRQGDARLQQVGAMSGILRDVQCSAVLLELLFLLCLEGPQLHHLHRPRQHF
jgi:hypothetical protein